MPEVNFIQCEGYACSRRVICHWFTLGLELLQNKIKGDEKNKMKG